ncbi:MAG: peptidoglycan DD-metalloendopeptidase family protein [Betaproteobacteria bacterium]|jgi:lipoprotein NlpD|nr:peptidoglycan DD-metalloendopeptidase family protein [Burkholderiaceae bacterium]MCZ8109309.1 peptidoglycan DD-metalloendopeptidase family protein [Rubrivivax sp.]MCZ8174885.1 peptidoglycan DD-metalloendopeptidase family protein [Burkholderiaceae bacterium]
MSVRFPILFERALAWALAATGVALAAGCASPNHRAPVEDRSGSVRAVPGPRLPGAVPVPGATAPALPSDPTSTPTPVPEPVRLPPGAENAGKPGYYTVKRGDTLYAIGLESGQSYRDIARWNGLENPNLIEVGQVLRVVPPSAEAPTAVARPVAPAGRVETRPLASPGTPSAAGGPVAAPGAASGPVAQPAVPAPQPLPTSEGEEGIVWSWPAAGPVATPFEDNKTKGLAITGKAGDPVLAAADGRVVYAGSGLRGYGNLVIVKHNNLFLSAYGHNQALLVKEDQIVRRGQRIAEMGSTDAERVQLHFEIRRQGKPVDPARLLPPR